MPESGTSTLRRLFPSHAIIASYSPDALPTRWAAERVHQLRGKRCVLKLQKQVPLTFHLSILLVKLYAVGGFRGAWEVFQAKIQSQHAVWMPSGEVDALFRLTLDR